MAEAERILDETVTIQTKTMGNLTTSSEKNGDKSHGANGSNKMAAASTDNNSKSSFTSESPPKSTQTGSECVITETALKTTYTVVSGEDMSLAEKAPAVVATDTCHSTSLGILASDVHSVNSVSTRSDVMLKDASSLVEDDGSKHPKSSVDGCLLPGVSKGATHVKYSSETADIVCTGVSSKYKSVGFCDLTDSQEPMWTIDSCVSLAENSRCDTSSSCTATGSVKDKKSAPLGDKRRLTQMEYMVENAITQDKDTAPSGRKESVTMVVDTRSRELSSGSAISDSHSSLSASDSMDCFINLEYLHEAIKCDSLSADSIKQLTPGFKNLPNLFVGSRYTMSQTTAFSGDRIYRVYSIHERESAKNKTPERWPLYKLNYKCLSANALQFAMLDKEVHFVMVGRIRMFVFRCKFCSYCTFYRDWHILHLDEHFDFSLKLNATKTLDTDAKQKRSDFRYENKNYECLMCSVRTTSSVIFYEHVRMHLIDKAYQCGYCNMAASTVRGLKEHIAEAHKNNLASMKLSMCQMIDDIMDKLGPKAPATEQTLSVGHAALSTFHCAGNVSATVNVSPTFYVDKDTGEFTCAICKLHTHEKMLFLFHLCQEMHPNDQPCFHCVADCKSCPMLVQIMTKLSHDIYTSEESVTSALSKKVLPQLKTKVAPVPPAVFVVLATNTSTTAPLQVTTNLPTTVQSSSTSVVAVSSVNTLTYCVSDHNSTQTSLFKPAAIPAGESNTVANHIGSAAKAATDVVTTAQQLTISTLPKPVAATTQVNCIPNIAETVTNEEIATVSTDETTTVCEQLAPEEQPTKPNETMPNDDNKANTSKRKFGFAIVDGRYTCKLCKYGTTEIESFQRHMSKEIHGRKRCSGLNCVKCSSLKGLMNVVRCQKLDSSVGYGNEENGITVTESRPAASVANNVLISNTVDSVTGTGESATNTGVSAPKSGVSAPKAVESATKTCESASKTGASAPKTVQSSAESVPKSGKSASKNGQSASKTGESASKTGESVKSAVESVAKSGKSASKNGESASKTGECASKTGECASKTGESATKTGESATTTNEMVEIDDRPFYRCSFPGCNFSCLRDKDFLVHNVSTHPSAFSYPCHYCSCLWDSAERIMGHLKSHSSKQSYRCIHCDITFTSQHAMNNHIENNHQGNTKFCCNHCDFQSMTYTYYKVHYFTAHANAQTHKCFQCGTVVNSMLDMFTHIEKRVSYTYRCTMCNMFSRFKHQVQRHVQVAHSQNNGHFIAYISFVCKSDESANTKTPSPNIALTSSKQSSVTNKQINTSSGQATPSSSTNVTQMSRHLSTQYMCSWCNYRSESETPVLSHILTCSNSLLNKKQQSKCTRCTFTCQSNSMLQQHSRWHLSPQDPLSAFVCSQCPFGSNSYPHFCGHSQYHVLENSATVLKYFRCNHCKYSSNQWNLAVQHISTEHRDVKTLTEQSKFRTSHASNIRPFGRPTNLSKSRMISAQSTTETNHVSNTKQVAKPTNSNKAKSSEKADDDYVGFENNDHIYSRPTLRTRQPRNYAEPEIEDTSSTQPTTLTSVATIDRFHCDLCEFGCSDRDQFQQHNLQHQVPVTASAPSESQNQVPVTASAPLENQNRAPVTASAPSEDERQVPVTPIASPKNPNQAPVTPKAPPKDPHQVHVTSSGSIENSTQSGKSSNQDDDDGDSTYKPDNDDDDDDDDDDYMDDDFSDTDDTKEAQSKADLTYCVPVPNKDLYKCVKCCFMNRFPSKVQRHYRYRHAPSYPYRCGYCEFHAVESGKVKRHCAIVHKELQVRVLKVTDEQGDGVLMTNAPAEDVEEDDDEGHGEELVVKHIEKMDDGRHKCALCKYVQLARSSIKRHILAVHLHFHPFACKYCSYTSVQASKVRLHTIRSHPGRPSAISKRSYPDIISDDQTAREEDESANMALSTEAQTTAVTTKAPSLTLPLAPIMVPPTVATPSMVPTKDARIVEAQSTDSISILETALATNAETSMERSQSAAPAPSLVKIKAEPPDTYEVSSLKKKFYKCVYCDFCDEKSITVLREHILLTHLKRKRYWCEWCGYEHMRRDYVTVHHKSHHSNCLLRVGVDKIYNNNIIPLESHGDVRIIGVVNDEKVPILELNDGVIVDGRAIGEARKTFDELEEDTHGKKQKVVSDTTMASAVDASEVTTSNMLNKSDLERRERRTMKCDLCDHRLKSKAKVDHHRQIHFEYRSFGCCYCSFQVNTRGRVMEHCRLFHPELPATHKTIPRPEQISNAEDANASKRPRLASDGSDVEMTPGRATRNSMARLFMTPPKKVMADEKPAAKKAKIGPASKIGRLKETKVKIDTKRPNVKTYQCTLCNEKLRSESAMYDHLAKELDYKKYMCGYCSRSTCLLDEMKKHSVIAHKGLNLSVSKHYDAEIEEKLESLMKQSAVTEHGDTEKAHDSMSEQSNDEQQIISEEESASSPERTLPVPVTSTLSKTYDAPSNTASPRPTNRPTASRKRQLSTAHTSPAVAQPTAQPAAQPPAQPLRISPFCCGFCSYTTLVATEIRAHMEDHMLRRSRAFECGYCNFAGESYDTVVQHSTQMHVNWPHSVMNNLDTGPNAAKLSSAVQTQASQAQRVEQAAQAHQPPAHPAQQSQAQPAPESAVMPASPALQVACVSTDAVLNVSEKPPRKHPTAMKHTAPRSRDRKSATNVVIMQRKAEFRCANCSFRTLSRALGLGHCRGRHRASDVVTLVDDYFLADATHYDENGVGFCSLRYRCARCHHADSRYDVIKHARAQHGSAKIIEKRRWHGQRSAQRPNFQIKLQLTDIAKMPAAKRLSFLRKNGVRRTQI